MATSLPRPKANLSNKCKRGPKNESQHSHGVVSICSPVNTAFAPAKKHIDCSDSVNVCRPAASRIMVFGNTIRAVAIVRRTVWYGTGYVLSGRYLSDQTTHTSFSSRGVPGIGTSAFTGKDSGCSGMLECPDSIEARARF